MAGYIQEIRRKIGHDRLIAVGAGVFVYRDGKVLLQRRRDNHCWAMHGGCVEVGEAVEDAARRELLEETGLVAGRLTLLGVFSGEDMLYTYPNGDNIYIIGVTYVCTDFSGEPLPETEEAAELRWFAMDGLPDAVTPPDRKPLAAFAAYVKREEGFV